MFEKNGQKVKRAFCAASFHGETWYKCPFCNGSFEFYDTQFGRGFIKTDSPGVYLHKKCGNYLELN